MWTKNFRQRKLQTVLIFLITVICTTLLSGALSILTSLDKPSRDFAEATKAADVKVYPYYSDEAAIRKMGSQFAELDTVDRVEYVVSHYITENLYLNDKKLDTFTYLTEYNDDIYGSDYYQEGYRGIGNSLKDNECILPISYSTEYDIHTGDTVTVLLGDEKISYTVAAVYSDPFQTSTAFDSDILIKKLPEVISNIYFFVYGKDDVTGKQIAEEYREKHNGRLNGFVFTLEDRINNGLIVGRLIGALFLAIGAIMLFVSALMIYYMIKNVMIADAKSIATYKTLGYTSNDVLFMYLQFYFTVITLACIVGCAGSVVVSNSILTSVFENMGQLKANNTLWSGVACYLVIISFVITIIALIISKSKRIKPVHALNGDDYGGIKKKKHYKGNSRLQFSALGIAFRTFMREKRSAVGIIITCIVTIFSVNFIVITLDVANSMKENNDAWIGVDKADVMIKVSDMQEYFMITKILEEDKRTDYFIGSNLSSKVTMKWVKGMEITNMDAFVYDDFSVSKNPVTKGRNPENGGEIAISTSVAQKLHKSIGDYLEIYLDDDKKADMLITGLFQSYMQFGNMCRLTTSAYREHGSYIEYNNISVYLRNKSDTEGFIEDMKQKIGGNGNVIQRTEQFGSIMDMIMKPQLKAIPPVAAMIFMIAGLNIFCIVYLKNLKSQKINGVYKCIGYTTWHLIFSNLWYVAAIAAVSVIITMPVSILTYAPIMRMCLFMFHFLEYPMSYQLLHLVLANIAVVIIFTISTMASSKALFAVNARDLVQE